MLYKYGLLQSKNIQNTYLQDYFQNKLFSLKTTVSMILYHQSLGPEWNDRYTETVEWIRDTEIKR